MGFDERPVDVVFSDGFHRASYKEKLGQLGSIV
jgi:hypothetical protein